MHVWITALLVLAASAHAQMPGVEHVLVIGVDGLSPKGLELANTPNIDSLIAGGAWTYHARGVLPTVSAPNWASMIMGAGPEQHGVTSNEWLPIAAAIKPTVWGPGKIFPTIFSVLHEQRPAATIGVMHHWKGFTILFQHDAVNKIQNPETEDATAAAVCDYIRKAKPTFLFSHFDHVDHALHHDGFCTPPYVAAVEKLDILVGQILAALKEAGIFEKTIILLTADHGGNGKGHGGTTMQELEIPWILTGPGVKQNHEIQMPVNTFDTACTIGHIFGLKQPIEWIGRPVSEAFTE